MYLYLYLYTGRLFYGLVYVHEKVVLTSELPSSAEVKGRVELYVYSPSGPSWPFLS
jgi:hypothetical protein